MVKMRWYDWLAYIILVIGAINWGIYGVSHHINKPFDLITYLGELTSHHLGHLIFVIIGLAGIYAIFTGFKIAFKK